MNGQCLRHPNVKDCVGKVALQRGPIVYCFEGADHGGRVLDLVLSADAVFTPRRRDDLLEGELTYKKHHAFEPSGEEDWVLVLEAMNR